MLLRGPQHPSVGTVLRLLYEHVAHYLKVKVANWHLVPGILSALPLTMQNSLGRNVVSQPAEFTAFSVCFF